MNIEPDAFPNAQQWIVDEHIVIDRVVIEIDERTWAIQGDIPYDGETIVAEFESVDEAAAAIEWIAAAEE